MPEENRGSTEALILRAVAAAYTIVGIISGLVIWNKWGTTSSYATRLQEDAAAVWVIVAIVTIGQAIMFGSVMYALAAICENTAEMVSRRNNQQHASESQ